MTFAALPPSSLPGVAASAAVLLLFSSSLLLISPAGAKILGPVGVKCSLPLTCDLKGRREVLHVTRATSENACLIKCQESKECTWYTYFELSRMCQILRGCPGENEGKECHKCLTGQKECPSIEEAKYKKNKLEAERAEKDEEGDGDEKRKVIGGGGGGGLWKNFAIAASMFGFAIGAYKLVQSASKDRSRRTGDKWK